MIDNQTLNEEQNSDQIKEEIIDKDVSIDDVALNDDKNKDDDTNTEKKEPKPVISEVNYLDPEILNIKTYSIDELEKLNVEENDNEDDNYSSNFIEVNEREVTQGTVVAINEKGILVDIGFKSEGVIERSEFSELTFSWLANPTSIFCLFTFLFWLSELLGLSITLTIFLLSSGTFFLLV